MAVIGTLIGGALGGFGKKPEVPVLRGIDPSQIQAATIAANKQQLPQLEAIGKQVNQFNLDQQLGMLSQALNFVAPGQLQQAQGIVGSQLRGEVPADVQLQVQRRAAAQALLGGFGGGSGIGRNLMARDFGLTSMGIQQQGLSNFGSLSSLAPRPTLFDMSSMFFTPQQRLEFAFRDRETGFNRDWRAAQVNAAPDPFRAALTQAFIQDEQAILELVGNIVGFAGGAAGAAAGCWVARAAFGERSPEWRFFRLWLLTKAPESFKTLYIQKGPRAGETIKRSSLLKSIFRQLMLPFVVSIQQRYA